MIPPSNFDSDKFAAAIRARRKEKGEISQAQAGGEAGVSQGTIHRAEMGYGEPTTPNLIKLLAWLGRPLDDFVTSEAAETT